MRFKPWVQDKRRQRALLVREALEDFTRSFFRSRKFREVKTPLLVCSPGMEPHIRPMILQNGTTYLPTSPEFSMKKLLAGGIGNIFQISPAFRSEALSNTHLPEFSLLEFYRAPGKLEEVMEDIELWISGFADKLYSASKFIYQGRTVSLASPWPRYTTAQLFKDSLGIDLSAKSSKEQFIQVLEKNGIRKNVSASTSWDDLYFEVWLNLIEPTLPKDQAFFVTHYPPSQAALAEIWVDENGNSWAQRAEFYIGGLELGNGFQELTDPAEQRARFISDMELRKKTYGDSFPVTPIDEELISALDEGLPQSAGIAVGMDRLVMLFADETDIRYTTWLLPVHGTEIS